MAARRLVEALIGVSGIWLVARQIPDYMASAAIALTSSDPVPQAQVLFVQSVHFLTGLVLGFVLVSARKGFALWFAPDESDIDANAGALLAVGVAIVSVYFMLSGVVALGEYLGLRATSDAENPYLVWRAAFAIGGGLLMFAFSVRIGRIWRVLRGREPLM